MLTVGAKSGAWRLRQVLLTATGLLLASCASNSASIQQQPNRELRTQGAPAEAAGLASPTQVRAADPAPRGHQGSYVEDDLLKLGEQFDPAGPLQNAAVVNAPELSFTPAKSGEDGRDGLEGLALATFRFDVPDYDRDPNIHFAWTTAPDVLLGTPCWIGLSNWDRQSWDWFHYDSSDVLTLDSLEPYFDPAGRLYVLVALSDTQPAELTSIRLGGAVPTALLSASPRRGAPPLEVRFDASASLAGSDSIVSFEWDFDGDGVYEPGASGPLVWHEYAAETDVQAAVRVTNDLGNQSVATSEIKLGHFWQRSFGLSGLDTFRDSSSDGAGNLYLLGSTADPNNEAVSRIMLIKLNPAGQLLWARRYGFPDDTSLAKSVTIDSSQNVYVGGTEYLGGQNAECLVQKWNPAGELLWARTYGNADGDYLQDMVCSGDSVYFCGEVNQPIDLLLARLDLDGDVVWLRSRDLGSIESGGSLDLKKDLQGNVLGAAVLGFTSLPGGDQLIHVDYDADGSFSSAATLADNSLPRKAGQIIYSHNFISGTTRYLVSGRVEVNGSLEPFMLVLPPAGDSIAGYRLSGLDCGSLPGLLSDGAGGFYLSASARIVGGDFTSLSCLLHLNAAGQLASAQYLESGSHYTGNNSLDFYSDGLLLSGYGPDAFPELTALSTGSQAYSDHWVETTGSSTSPQWNVGDGMGLVVDMAESLMQDSGAGSFDALVSFVPLPQ